MTMSDLIHYPNNINLLYCLGSVTLSADTAAKYHEQTQLMNPDSHTDTHPDMKHLSGDAVCIHNQPSQPAEQHEHITYNSSSGQIAYQLLPTFSVTLLA
ncbi:hypothetical protein AOLI_G00302500 [Acnodon oligacanthus]